MTDVHDIKTRSYNMSMIKGKNTKPEIIVRKFLFKNGYRYRLYDSKLPGKPDIVLRKYKTVIFINGCFWHGHKECKYFVVPKTRTDWWLKKIEKTKERDEVNYKQLKKEGWNIIVIWECELKENRDKRLTKLLKEIAENGQNTCN
jgi:DNA mismatch endonuclease (patch repair protein)